MRGTSPPPPVRPPPELLPLGSSELPWTQFERFTAAFVSQLPDVVSVHNYGTPGNAQRGIDVAATLRGGKTRVLQCRQWKSFTAANVKSTVKATKYKADAFVIAVACVVGVRARDEIKKHRGWELWDQRDISRKVRELPPASACSIVSLFGGSWPREFLGITGPLAFRRPSDFFARLLDANHLFHHAWTLVGRADELARLQAFMTEPRWRAAILSGPGGVGKSKLLHAFASQVETSASSVSIWFLEEGVPLDGDALSLVPPEPCVVVVDDAHRRDDIGLLLAHAHQRSVPLKLLFSTRPQGIESVESALTRAHFDTREVFSVGALGDLSSRDLQSLAEQVLGENYEEYAARLAAVAAHCPLVVVVGGRLLRDKHVRPELLEQNDEFRHAALRRFQEILVGEVANQIEPKLCSEILSLCAALAPVPMTDDRRITAASKFLGITPRQLREHLGLLEYFGVLVRRGSGLRIAPDVLGDHILHNRCIGTRLDSTGYARELFNAFSDVALTDLLRNLAELDWRMSAGAGGVLAELGEIWNEVNHRFRTGDAAVKRQLLTALARAAPYQPRRTLELVEHAMSAELTPDGNSGWRGSLVHVVQNLAMNVDVLPRCCDLLWELGRDDPRPTTNSIGHPMTVLADIAAYDLDKPLRVNEIALAAVEQWLQQPGVHGHVHSPLDVLEPLLLKASTSTRHDEAHRFTIRSFAVRGKGTDQLRARGLSCLADCARAESPRVAARAIEILCDAAGDVLPMYGRAIDQEERDFWVEHRLLALRIVTTAIGERPEAALHVAVKNTLAWDARRARPDVVRDRARAIIASLPNTFDFRLAKAVSGSFALSDTDDGGRDYERHAGAWTAFLRQTVRELVQQRGDPGAGAQLVDAALAGVVGSNAAQPGALLHVMADTEPTYALGVVAWIATHPSAAMAPHVASLLVPARAHDAAATARAARQVVETADPTLCSGIAAALGASAAELSDDETSLLAVLLEHPSSSVRGAALRAVGRLGAVNPTSALRLAAAVDIADNDELAQWLCALVDARHGIAPEALSATDLDRFLAKLESCRRLDCDAISSFLRAMVPQAPRQVVRMLIARVHREGLDPRSCKALPYEGLSKALLGLLETPEGLEAIRYIRDLALDPTDSHRFWSARLFRETVDGSGRALAVLDDWVGSRDPRLVRAIAELVGSCSPRFVFRNVLFVLNLLRSAAAAGCYEDVRQRLESLAISGSRSGPAGEPMPQDVELRNNARFVAGMLPPNARERSFMEALVDHAERNIRDSRERDREWLDS